MEDWMVTPMPATMTLSWLNTTQVEQSSGLSSLGHQVVILLMELRPTHPETSMFQETHMEDWNEVGDWYYVCAVSHDCFSLTFE